MRTPPTPCPSGWRAPRSCCTATPATDSSTNTSKTSPTKSTDSSTDAPLTHQEATMSTTLTIDVFNGGDKPIPHGGLPGWDRNRQATWPASTATLISGSEHAVLIDALLTMSEGERLARWV